MQTTFMVTNGGPHPFDKWAEMTAATIVDTLMVDTNPDSVEPEAVAARADKRKIYAALFDVFNVHHAAVQNGERAECAKCKKPADAAARAIKPIDCTPHLSVMDNVNEVLATSMFADHFAKPEVQEVIRGIIGQHTTDVIHIERRWHHDTMTKGA